jgi:hypothetical protein
MLKIKKKSIEIEKKNLNAINVSLCHIRENNVDSHIFLYFFVPKLFSTLMPLFVFFFSFNITFL